MNKKGFTLIEFLIYGAIVSFFIASLTMISVEVLQGRIQVTAMESVGSNSRFVIQKITYDIRNATGASVVDQNLVLETDDGPVEYFLDTEDNRVKYQKGEYVGVLTSGMVEVTQLNFNIPEENLVKIELELNFYNPDNQPQYEMKRKFITTETVRN